MGKVSKQLCTEWWSTRHWRSVAGWGRLLLLGGLCAYEVGCGSHSDKVKTHRDVDDQSTLPSSGGTTDAGATSEVLTSGGQTSSEQVGAARACYVESRIIALGATFPCPDSCNTCECTASGIEWRSHDECPGIAVPDGCEGTGRTNGETWACDDGCSTCKCESGVVSRSFQFCDKTHVCEGEFLIHEQAELDVLAECSEITSHLYIFADLDLEPLAKLRRVNGILSLSNMQDEGMAPGFASLKGLRSLEHAGALWLANVMVNDLSELEHLSEIGGSEFGGLQITNGSRGLRDLSGLEHLTLLDSLALSDLDNLETLEGAQFPKKTDVSLSNLPFFESLQGLREVEELGSLSVVGCGGLGLIDTGNPSVHLGELTIEDNPGLVSIGTGLEQLSALGSLRVRQNPILHAMSLPALQTVAGSLWIERNDQLAELDLPVLELVDKVVVIHNSKLLNADADALAANLVAPRVVKVALNKNDPLGVRDPCPWLEDGECDERLGICTKDGPDCFSLWHQGAP